jgi:hypothetical protein
MSKAAFAKLFTTNGAPWHATVPAGPAGGRRDDCAKGGLYRDIVLSRTPRDATQLLTAKH